MKLKMIYQIFPTGIVDIKFVSTIFLTSPHSLNISNRTGSFKVLGTHSFTMARIGFLSEYKVLQGVCIILARLLAPDL